MDNRPVVASLDFDQIKSDLVSFFKDRPEFKDYNFEGSGLNLLMDILAYNTHYNALAANFQLNESFLDTALIRQNVVSLAKSLNYVPRSSRAATTVLNLNVPRRSGEPYYIIPGGTLFQSSIGNQKLNFYTIQDYSVNYSLNDITRTVNVQVYEGDLITQRFIMGDITDEFPAFDLGQTNIDTTTLTVTVDGLKHTQLTPELEGMNNTTKDSTIYFVEETKNKTHRILFGNNVVGAKPSKNSVILVTYIATNAEAGNGVRLFSTNITNRTDITILGNVTPTQGGTSPETISEIKDNAPHWYQSQFRAVTENDYGALLKNKFADIQSINVYGGEKIGKPGNVYISVKPKSGDKLTASTKDTILTEILNPNNVVTIRPKLVDPFIMKVVLKTILIYDDKLLASSKEILKSKLLTLLRRLNTTYVGDFMNNFNISVFSSHVEELDTSIVSSNTRVLLRVDNVALNGLLDFYSWTYNNRIYHPNDGFNAVNGGVFSSNLFFREGRTYQSGFDEDGYGNIRLYDFIDNTKITVNDRAGTINYETGEVDIQDFDPANGSILFTAVPDSFDVLATENTILQIADEASLVDVVEKNDTATIKNINLSRSL
jgi:hypothetical protein